MPGRPSGTPHPDDGLKSNGSTDEDAGAPPGRKAAKDAAKHHFGENLRQVCEMLTITAAQLATLCDVSARVAESWMRGENEPSLVDLPVIARVTGMSIDVLLAAGPLNTSQPSAIDQAFALAIIQRVFEQQRGRVELSFYGNPAAAPQRLLFLPGVQVDDPPETASSG